MLCLQSTEYEAQSSELEKELQDVLTSRKDLESTNEGKLSPLIRLVTLCSICDEFPCKFVWRIW